MAAESTDKEQLLYSIVVRLGDMEKQMKRAADSAAKTYFKMQEASKSGTEKMAQDAERATNRVNKAVASTSKNIGDMGKAYQSVASRMMSSVAAIALPVIGIGSIAGLTQYADTWSDLNARLTNSTGSTEAATKTMARLGEVADRTYSSLETTVESFIANSRALKDLGYNTSQQLDYTEALNNALVISAAKGDRAASVQNALAKAMAAGKLSGDNLNTVIQTGGRVAEVLADSMGVTVNELAALGQKGKITGDVIFKALIGNMQKLRDEAESMDSTIEDGFTRMGNSLLKFIGTMDQTLGISGAVANGLIFIGDNIGAIASGAATAAAVLLAANGAYIAGLAKTVAAQAMVVATNPYLLLATAIGAAVTALVAFSDEIIPVQGEMANLGDYAAEAWATIKDGAVIAWQVVSDAFNGLVNLITDGLTNVGANWEDVWNVIKGYSNAMIAIQMFVVKTAIATWTKLPKAIADATITTINNMIEAVEKGINGVVNAVNQAVTAINNLSGTIGIKMGTIDPVQLKRMENKFAGAGAAAGEAYKDAFDQFGRDFVGETLGQLGELTQGLRDRANKRAEDRKNAPDDSGGTGGGNKPIASGGDSGGKGGKAKESDFAKQVAQIKEQTKALQDQAEIQAQITPLADDYGYKLAKITALQQLYNAAQKDGVKITPEVAQGFEVMADSLAKAQAKLAKIKEGQQDLVDALKTFKDVSKDATRTFVDGLIDGKSASEALGNALMRLGQRLLDSGMDTIFNSVFSSIGGGKGIFGSLFGGKGFSTGTSNTGGKKNEPRGVVHGQEAVIPLPNGGRVPVQVQGNQQSKPTQSNVSVSVAASDLFHVMVKETAQEQSQQAVKNFATSREFKQMTEGVTRSVIKNPSKRF